MNILHNRTNVRIDMHEYSCYYKGVLWGRVPIEISGTNSADADGIPNSRYPMHIVNYIHYLKGSFHYV